MFLLFFSVAMALSVSALCSLLEATLLSLPSSQVAMMASRRPRVAAVWKHFKRHIERPIAVILIVNTAAHTVGATIAGARFELVFGERWLLAFSLLFTYLMLQFSEVLPKTLGVRYNRKIAPYVALPLNTMATFLAPVMWLVHLVNRPFERERVEADTTLEEITSLVAMASISQLIDPRQERMIRAAAQLDNVRVRQVMTPRTEVVHLRLDQPMEQILEIVQSSPYTRLPLCSPDIDHVVGLVHIKDLFNHLDLVPGRFDVVPATQGDEDGTAQVVAIPGSELHVFGSGSVHLKKISREILFMSNNTSGLRALRQFQEMRRHIAVVVDEHGSTLGIVTLEDIIEQMVGDIEDEFDTPAAPLVVREGETYRVSGRTRIQELLQHVPDLEISEERVDTIGGYVAKALGRMPAVGDTINLGSHLLHVVAADSRRVQEVLLTPSAPHAE